mgnify:CR=1 FL=1
MPPAATIGGSNLLRTQNVSSESLPAFPRAALRTPAPVRLTWRSALRAASTHIPCQVIAALAYTANRPSSACPAPPKQKSRQPQRNPHRKRKIHSAPIRNPMWPEDLTMKWRCFTYPPPRLLHTIGRCQRNLEILPSEIDDCIDPPKVNSQPIIIGLIAPR